jgi:hypothetical protein
VAGKIFSMTQQKIAIAARREDLIMQLSSLFLERVAAAEQKGNLIGHQDLVLHLSYLLGVECQYLELLNSVVLII